MTTLPEPAAAPLFARLERRMLLWLVVAAVCWRWFLAVRTEAPAADGCLDLWLAQRLAAGSFADLAGQWWQPWWALLVAPAVACGAEPLIAAQALGALLGGLTLWPAAVAAERLREGAGLPAAVLALATAPLSQAAAAGSALPLLAFLAALAAAAAVRGRWLAASMLLAPAAAGAVVAGPAGAPGGWFAPAWAAVRTAWSVAGALALLSMLPPRPRRIPCLWLAVLLVLGWSSSAGRGSAALCVAAPWVAILAGVGLARLPGRLRDVALVVVVAVDFLAAWRHVEPPNLQAERLVGTWLRERLAPGQVLVGDLPRVAFYAGLRPQRSSPDEVLALASRPDVVGVVLSAEASRQSTLTAALAGRFARQSLPSDLGAGMQRHVAVFWRRD